MIKNKIHVIILDILSSGLVEVYEAEALYPRYYIIYKQLLQQ